MYTVKQTSKPNPKGQRSKTAASAEEIAAAVGGKLKPRAAAGDNMQPTLVQRGVNDMPVGRPVGMTTGLPIFMAICYAFQQNERAKTSRRKPLTDARLAEWLRHEFPGRSTTYWDRIQEMRRYYNAGRYTRGTKPMLVSHRYDDNGQQFDPNYARG